MEVVCLYDNDSLLRTDEKKGVVSMIFSHQCMSMLVTT